MSRSHIRPIVAHKFPILLTLTITLGAGLSARAERSDLERLVGQPADIASSAYQYRADRNADQNPPESWLALMGMPTNR